MNAWILAHPVELIKAFIALTWLHFGLIIWQDQKIRKLRELNKAAFKQWSAKMHAAKAAKRARMAQ